MNITEKVNEVMLEANSLLYAVQKLEAMRTTDAPFKTTDDAIFEGLRVTYLLERANKAVRTALRRRRNELKKKAAQHDAAQPNTEATK